MQLLVTIREPLFRSAFDSSEKMDIDSVCASPFSLPISVHFDLTAVFSVCSAAVFITIFVVARVVLHPSHLSHCVSEVHIENLGFKKSKKINELMYYLKEYYLVDDF